MRNIQYTLYREGADDVAQCLDFEVSSFGDSKEEALRMLNEAVELYLLDFELLKITAHAFELFNKSGDFLENTLLHG